MSRYDELQKAAEYAAQDTIKFADESEEMRALQQFHEEVNPETVLVLIAENERLRESDQESTELCDTLSALLGQIAVAVRGPEEPKSRHGFHDLPSRVKTVVAERDQLKSEVARSTEREILQLAEIEGLKAQHGRDSVELRKLCAARDSARKQRDQLKDENNRLQNEAVYAAAGFDAAREEVARLKAENEALRKDVDRAAYWKQRAKSAEGHLFSGDFRVAAMELHKYSQFESTPWPELTGSQHALITSAAGAVIATVNRLRDTRRPKNHTETDAIIWCACGDGHAANSYGAGFMDANNGVCANCDAAMGNGEQP